METPKQKKSADEVVKKKETTTKQEKERRISRAMPQIELPPRPLSMPPQQD